MYECNTIEYCAAADYVIALNMATWRISKYFHIPFQLEDDTAHKIDCIFYLINKPNEK